MKIFFTFFTPLTVCCATEVVLWLVVEFGEEQGIHDCVVVLVVGFVVLAGFILLFGCCWLFMTTVLFVLLLGVGLELLILLLPLLVLLLLLLLVLLIWWFELLWTIFVDDDVDGVSNVQPTSWLGNDGNVRIISDGVNTRICWSLLLLLFDCEDNWCGVPERDVFGVVVADVCVCCWDGLKFGLCDSNGIIFWWFMESIFAATAFAG